MEIERDRQDEQTSPPEPAPEQAEEKKAESDYGQLYEPEFCSVRNRTGRRIGISSWDEKSDKVLILPPFGQRSLTERHFKEYDTETWELHNLVSVRDDRSRMVFVRRLVPFLRMLSWFTWAVAAAAWFLDGLRTSFWFWIPAGLAYAGFACYFLVVIQPRLQFNRSIEFDRARAWIAQSYSLALILAIGIGLPVGTAWSFGGAELLESGALPDILGRASQVAFISIASLLPALLYYQFDRQHVGTLREIFYRNVIQLDPKVITMEDARSIYGGRVAEVYGAEQGAGAKFLQGTRLPIIVSTLVITLGWILTMWPVGPVFPDGNAEFLLALIPQHTAVGFGFLGGYFFAINMLLRRYSRADLKPKAYSHVTVRLFETFVVVWVISVLPIWGEGSGTLGEASQSANPYLLVFAFFVGIIPSTGIRVMREFLESLKILRNRIPSLDERQPLNNLDGITLYERARLVEEGIENIENLVYYPLVDLMLQTRIPLTRLIDWVDQGILYLHLADGKGGTPDLLKLREYGIRNASDLVEAYEAASERGGEEARSLLSILDGDPAAQPKRLQVIYDALQNDEWLENIVGWRDRNRLPGEHVFSLGEMFLSHDELIASFGTRRRGNKFGERKGPAPLSA